MNIPTQRFLAAVTGKQIQHGSNPVLNWMASNLAVSQDPAGSLKPDKAKSTEKIDGLVAKIMALGRAMLRGEKRSVYEDRGVLVI